jgi:uncharacterized membrane protein YjfL (UPF0719 family)
MIMIWQTVATILAFADGAGEPANGSLLFHIAAAVIFSIVGLLALGASVWLINKLLPFSLRKEIEEDHNTAVAIIVAAIILGMALIIASAIHG